MHANGPSLIRATEQDIRARGLTVDVICRRASIARSTWTRWKSGETWPNSRTWQRVLEALGNDDPTTPTPTEG